MPGALQQPLLNINNDTPRKNSRVGSKKKTDNEPKNKNSEANQKKSNNSKKKDDGTKTSSTETKKKGNITAKKKVDELEQEESAGKKAAVPKKVTNLLTRTYPCPDPKCNVVETHPTALLRHRKDIHGFVSKADRKALKRADDASNRDLEVELARGHKEEEEKLEARYHPSLYDSSRSIHYETGQPWIRIALPKGILPPIFAGTREWSKMHCYRDGIRYGGDF